MATLQISLFGHVTVVYPSGSAPVKLSRSIQALLAYLLLQPGLVQRDVLMDVFWVDAPPDRARSNLTTALWRLRQLLESGNVRPGAYLITGNTGEVGFNWESDHWLDAAVFEKSISPLLRKPLSTLSEEDMRQIEGVLVLYQGDLLEGVYEDWALRQRERFRSLYLNCLTRLMHYYAAHKEFERSIFYGSEILRCDSLREDIHRDLMRIYLESGQRTLAMRQYVQCRDLLSRELDALPLEETQALYQQIAATAQGSAAIAPMHSAHPELAHLFQELQRVQQSIGEASAVLARIQAAVGHLTNLPHAGDGAVTQE